MALPEFLIRLPDFDAQVRCADIPASAFFDGFPDDMPMTECWLAAEWNEQHAVAVGMQHWITGMLARAAVDPVLTPEHVNRLGPSRAVLAQGYLETVGWIPRDRDLVPGVAPVAPVDVRPAPRGHGRRRTFPLSSLSTVPGKNLRERLRLMASRTRTLPSVLWALPISEWIFTFRVLADPQVAPEDVLGL